MQPSEFKDYLVKAVATAAGAESAGPVRQALTRLAGRLNDLADNDDYLEQARQAHDAQPDPAQHKDALKTALSEYHNYDSAQQLPTVFLIDLVNASHPEEGFV